ncbi:MAG TPA: magnesium chelatase domain-containing protein, partial [Candidatus Sumerlaeota bacterium]|nr:magnesium chelatase domain-containing protein [Candidatus Sumerlaeota bacterium]
AVKKEADAALKAHGLIKKKVRFEDEAVDTIIQRYTREAGVRNLEREIATLCRKTARRLIAGGEESAPRITPQLVRALLGPERHHDLQIHDKTEVGVATGLAWTDAGGEILPTETTTMPGKGNLQLTGKLGEVMKESGQAALSYLRSRSGQYGLAPDFHKELDIHVHIPEGAIPKDGPSAGVTLVTSMYSALTGRPVRQDVAMTGEITLRGKVLKIGGLKEKVIAAHRNHLRTVLIPADNEPELEEIAPEILRELDIRPVRTVDEVLALALADEPARPDKSGGKPRRGQSGRGAGRRQPARGLGINA